MLIFFQKKNLEQRNRTNSMNKKNDTTNNNDTNNDNNGVINTNTNGNKNENQDENETKKENEETNKKIKKDGMENLSDTDSDESLGSVKTVSSINSEKQAFLEHMAMLKRTNKIAHWQFYRYHHISYTVRKAYALVLALPWEATMDLMIERWVTTSTIDQIWVRCSIAIIITLVLSYFGIQCVRLQDQKCPQMGNDDLIKEILSEFHHRIVKRSVKPAHIDLTAITTENYGLAQYLPLQQKQDIICYIIIM